MTKTPRLAKEKPVTSLTDQQLDNLDEITNSATPGPWHLTDSGAIVAPLTQQHVADVWEPTAVSRNGEFIEAARDALPALVAEVRRLSAELDTEKRQHSYTLRQRNNRSERLLYLQTLANTGQTQLLAEEAKDTLSASINDHLPADSDEMAASLRRDGFGDDEIADMLGGTTTAGPDIAAADNPTPLRWGLNDVMWGDDDTTTVLLSGPDGEPYWLELDPERAAVLRQDLASPDGQEQPKPGQAEGQPRLLECGLCFEEHGEEVHPHPACTVERLAELEVEHRRWVGVHNLVERAIDKGVSVIDTLDLADALGPDEPVSA